MYVPRNSLLNLDGTSPKTRGRRRSLRNKYSVVFVSAALVLLLLTALLIQRTGSPDTSEALTTRYAHDLGQLWSWSDSVMSGGATNAEWTLRYDAVLSDKVGLGDLSDAVFASTGGKIETERMVTNNGNSISGQFPGNLGTGETKAMLSLHMTEEQGAEHAVILLLESGIEGATEQGLQTALTRLGAILSDTTQKWTLTMKTHGYSDTQGAADKLERMALGKVQEQYEDGGTRSITMLSDGLLTTKALDQRRRANLQVAVHHSTEAARDELTIGVPLISGDFSSVTAVENVE
ncbi:hypothetical protein ACX1C1_26675 [Paenibacillus sp. strain BS8-2]